MSELEKEISGNSNAFKDLIRMWNSKDPSMLIEIYNQQLLFNRNKALVEELAFLVAVRMVRT